VKTFHRTLAAALVASFASGCSSSDDTPANGVGGTAGAEAGPPRPSDVQARSSRMACEFDAGTSAAETLGESDPIGADIPVEHVIVLMMENRSFDHYFSKLPEYGQPDVAVANESFVNTDATGAPVAWFKTGDYCVRDPAHGWKAVHTQYNGGELDGFVISNEPDGARAMGYFDHTDLPFYYELANTFAISDSYFSSMLGPTWPNRMYLYSGSSHGLTENTLPSDVGSPNLFRVLNERQIPWRDYRSNFAPPAMFFTDWIAATKACSQGGEPCAVRDISQFFTDAAAGNLAPITFVDPEYVTGIYETSEHPPGNMQIGQNFVWKVVDAITRSPLWKKSVLFITYDEHGGFADSVAPPPACHPDTGDPKDPADAARGTFDRYGFRVPLIVVSPFAKQHYVSHTVTDHTSILRFIEARFGLPALSRRDANADALMDLFDFENPPFAEPPSFPEPVIDPDKLAECEQRFPGGG
jgi:phospholipase C